MQNCSSLIMELFSRRRSVWPDGKIISSIFGHLEKFKFAQWHGIFWHGKLKMFPSTKLTPKMMPKTFEIWPKWRNFPKSDHTEGDTQLDQLPKSQTSVECCHACTAYFLGVVMNTTAYHFGRRSLRLLLLKIFMTNIN